MMNDDELRKSLKSIINALPKKEENEAKTIKQCSIELYEVSDSYDSKQILSNIKEFALSNQTAYVIVFHDKDVFTEDTFNSYKQLVGRKGEPKKPHYHVLLKFPYRMNLGDVALRFGIEERWILKLKKESDFDRMIWYVTHEAYENI